MSVKKQNLNWKFYKAIPEGKKFEIDGINIWEKDWKSDYEKITVKDPLYGNLLNFTKFWITHNNSKLYFVAGEFSQNFWGFYLDSNDKNQPKKENPLKALLYKIGILQKDLTQIHKKAETEYKKSNKPFSF